MAFSCDCADKIQTPSLKMSMDSLWTGTTSDSSLRPDCLPHSQKSLPTSTELPWISRTLYHNYLNNSRCSGRPSHDLPRKNASRFLLGNLYLPTALLCKIGGADIFTSHLLLNGPLQGRDCFMSLWFLLSLTLSLAHNRVQQMCIKELNKTKQKKITNCIQNQE